MPKRIRQQICGVIFFLCNTVIVLSSFMVNGNHLPVTDYEYFYRTGMPPPDSEIDWPSSLSATIDIKISPMVNILDTAGVTLITRSIFTFYETIFDSQNEYELKIRSLDIVRQRLVSATDSGEKKDETTGSLVLETAFDVNYRGKVDEEAAELSSHDLKRILINLMNRFDTYFLENLHKHHAPFQTINDVLAHGLNADDRDNTHVSKEESNDTGNDVVSIIAISLSGFIFVVFSLATYTLYRRETKSNKRIQPQDINLSPFRERMEEKTLEETVEFGTIDGKERSQKLSSSPSFTSDMESSTSGYQRHSLFTQRKSNRRIGPAELERARAFLESNNSDDDEDDDEVEDNILSPIIDSRLEKQRSTSRRFHDVPTEVIHTSNKNRESSEGHDIPKEIIPDYFTNSSLLSADTMLLKQSDGGKSNRQVILAPAGKLGVAIDTVDGQPVVHRIKDNSPLEGILQRLDRIVALDGVDTSHMSAADVTHLMVKSMNKPRKIEFIRK